MVTRSQRTLPELFVNRERPLELFRSMLEGEARRRIMVLTAANGMGKSWTLRMFAREAGLRQQPYALLDFDDGQAYDVLTLVRRLRDALGAEHFNTLTAVINQVTNPRVTLAIDAPTNVNISVGDNNRLTDAPISIGDVAGTVVRDNLFVVPSDNPLIHQAIEDRITNAFFDNLATLSERVRVALLFDTYERNSLTGDAWSANTTDRWIFGQLLGRILNNRLPHVVVVLAGQRVPEFGVEWNEVLGRLTLDLLACDDVKTYLRERRGLTQITEAEGDRLCQAVGGIPQVLGLIGDNLELANRPQLADDEW